MRLILAALEGTSAADLKASQLDGLKFAVLNTVAMDDLRDAPRAAFQSAKERLAVAGAEITTIDFAPMQEAFDLAGILFTADSYSWWKDRVEAAPEKMFPRILERVRAGADVLAVDYLQAWRRLEEIRVEWRAATASFDAVIMPAAPILPPNADKLLNDQDYYVTENLLALRNTRVGNLMGECSLAMPTGVPSCGILFNAPPGDEERLLRLAAAAEAALS